MYDVYMKIFEELVFGRMQVSLTVLRTKISTWQAYSKIYEFYIAWKSLHNNNYCTCLYSQFLIWEV